MTFSLKKTLRRFRDSEDGSMVVPFALWLPLFVGIIVSGVELGTTTLRHTTLERALDETVRDVKLGTGTVYDHASLKAAICTSAAILPDCDANLQLEMIKMSMRNWTTPPTSADCVDTSAAVNPQRTFEYGRDNELMLLRACFKFKPLSPATKISTGFGTDAAGYTAIVSYSAFVQEPS